MANVSKIAGLTPVGYLNGAAWNGQARQYYISSTDTNAYAIGDPVDLSGSGDTNGVPGIVLVTAGNNSGANMVVGSIVGSGPNTSYANANNNGSIIVPATKSSAYYVMVADDPFIVFQMQEAGTALTAASIGLNCDLASGANNGYVSGWTLDNTATSTDAGYQMKLLGLARQSNNAFGQYAKWLTQINLHRFKAGVAGK